MAGMEDILKQANEMQQKMTQMQKEVEKMQAIGESGGGLMKVVVDGTRRVKRCFIDPRLFAFKNAQAGDDKVEGEGEGEVETSAIQKALLSSNLSEDDRKQMFEELIAAAINDGTEKIEKEIQGKIADMTKDIQLPPGFDLGDSGKIGSD